MAKQVRYFRQVVSHLEDKFGGEIAQAIMTKALKRYDDSIEENKDVGEGELLARRVLLFSGHRDDGFVLGGGGHPVCREPRASGDGARIPGTVFIH